MRTHQLVRYARIILALGLLILIFDAFNSLRGVHFLFETTRTHTSRSWHALHILKTTYWGSFNPNAITSATRRDGRWVDLAGFRGKAGFHWEGFATWRDKCGLIGERARTEWFFRGKKSKEDVMEDDWGNMRHIFHGRWVRYTDDLAEKKSGRSVKFLNIATCSDVKGDEGTVILRIDEKKSLEMELDEIPTTIEVQDELGTIFDYGLHRPERLVREVAATITIQDGAAGDAGLEMRVFGVHWPQIGSLLLTTTSRKFDGIFGLPHLSISKQHFLASQRLLNETIRRTLERKHEDNPWKASLGRKRGKGPRCEYVVYIQLHPLDGSTVVQKPVQGWEKFLFCPFGESVLNTTKVQISTVIFSPDCGFILESKGPARFPQTNIQQLACEPFEQVLS
ncbi:hypothetical protein BDZ45DRAFT_318392 [Acephala macrosclerotiorum]|nr:hypothetical protein BDZ45DRAFT_318392 [Acephala macrosclerotiorum]